MVAERRHGERARPGVRLLRRALVAWALVLAAAFLNGMLRKLALDPLLGRELAQTASIVILIAVLIAAAAWLVQTTHLRRPLGQWLLVGVLWAALTLAFELLFFHYVAGNPWAVVLAALDPRQGGTFALIVLATLLAPALVALAQRR